MSESSKSQFVSEAKGLAKFFECDVVIRLFGVVIWEWHFPPKNS